MSVRSAGSRGQLERRVTALSRTADTTIDRIRNRVSYLAFCGLLEKGIAGKHFPVYFFKD